MRTLNPATKSDTPGGQWELYSADDARDFGAGADRGLIDVRTNVGSPGTAHSNSDDAHTCT